MTAASFDVVAEPEGLEFTPDRLTIDEGDRVVVYHPAGSQLHNIHWDDRDAACPGFPTQDEWTCSRTFGRPDTFVAICDIHPDMTLTVRVRAAATPKPPPATPKPTPKPTKKPTPPPTQAPPDPTPPPTDAATPTLTAVATPAPSASPVGTASPSPVVTPASTPTPAPTGSSGSDGAGPLLLLLGLVIAGAVGGAALLRRRAAAPGRSAEA